jgi:hypothetical protein
MSDVPKKFRIRYVNPTPAAPGWNVVFICEHGELSFEPIAQWIQIEYTDANEEGKFLEENVTYSTEPMIVEGYSLVPLCTHDNYSRCLGISPPGEEKEIGMWNALAHQKMHELQAEETSTEVKAN